MKVMKSSIEDRRSSTWVCYYCRQKGHIQRNCPVLLEEIKAGMKKQTKEKSMAVQHPDPGSDSSGRGVCFTSTTGSGVKNAGRWIIDTGCTKHMTSSVESLSNRMPWEENVSLADGNTVKTKGRGPGRIIGRGMKGEEIEIKLKELLYVPELAVSALSVSRITDEGYAVVFGRKDCRILDGSTVIAVGQKNDGLYYLRQ